MTAALPPDDDTLAVSEDQSWMTPHLRLTVSMVLAARKWRSVLDEHFRPLGHSAARMEAMWAIVNTPPLSPQIEIARRIGIEGATLTRMLDSLEAEGLIERLAGPSDRRAKHIRLTEAGETALAELMAIAHGLRTMLLERLSPEEVGQANGLLGKLLDRFDDFPQPRG